jgi:hypothetical protein
MCLLGRSVHLCRSLWQFVADLRWGRRVALIVSFEAGKQVDRLQSRVAVVSLSQYSCSIFFIGAGVWHSRGRLLHCSVGCGVARGIQGYLSGLRLGHSPLTLAVQCGVIPLGEAVSLQIFSGSLGHFDRWGRRVALCWSSHAVWPVCVASRVAAMGFGPVIRRRQQHRTSTERWEAGRSPSFMPQ